MAQEASIRDCIDHIVVVMMENRSFDGIDPGHIVHWSGIDYPPYELGSTTWAAPDFPDPPHGGAQVAWQIAEPGRYIATYDALGPSPDPSAIVGYLTGNEVPVYDFLARQYCVCDRWFCSVPGATWPNRMFAVAGTAGGETDIPPTVLEGLWGKHTVFRELDRLEVTWSWYSSDPSLLRAIDPEYRADGTLSKFAFFDEYTERQGRNFLTEALSGTLPKVSWVDPNFFKLPVVDGRLPANDDHPPNSVTLGQKFIHVIYEALRRSKAWDRTLLLITYDEHGGFYDHVKPASSFGPRVPALVVSPYVEQGRPCHDVLEHTSIIKTILTRFGDEEALERMGPRVYYANDVWPMLTKPKARPMKPVADPGAAAISERDLEPRRLEWPAATLQRTISLIDEAEAHMTELQRDLLLVYERLRRWAPRPIARWLSRRFRKRDPAVTRRGRALVRPIVERMPATKRPMPERRP